MMIYLFTWELYRIPGKNLHYFYDSDTSRIFTIMYREDSEHITTWYEYDITNYKFGKQIYKDYIPIHTIPKELYICDCTFIAPSVFTKQRLEKTIFDKLC